ncbi:hypothetical protein IEQ34_014617 [Dendrobium chrysotoxum]|uniref:Uncharacterized protein n=1 Tax=Dendrobium chrysotoxum TaxID=161865 RepID=A0AAV7GM97_DENCH|nr:hypothetical protein IEQ34_014617 [Dendrobium chrysotoxum]
MFPTSGLELLYLAESYLAGLYPEKMCCVAWKTCESPNILFVKKTLSCASDKFSLLC